MDPQIVPSAEETWMKYPVPVFDQGEAKLDQLKDQVSLFGYSLVFIIAKHVYTITSFHKVVYMVNIVYLIIVELRKDTNI